VALVPGQKPPVENPFVTVAVDFVVIGGGIAGASLGSELAAHARVHLLEMEEQPGYHSTGRSAAVFAERYGNATIQALTRASRDFIYNPPAGFCAASLIKPRHVLITAQPAYAEALEQFLADSSPRDEVEVKSVDQAVALCPILRPELLAGALLVSSPADLEVHELLQGYLRLFKARGGTVATNTRVLDIARDADGWRVETTTGTVRAAAVVNAAGAWAGEIGKLAGAQDIGLVPMRRTVVMIDPPVGSDSDQWPLLLDAQEQFYLKPDAGMLLLSPGDETPSDPTDAQADEMDVAIAVDRIETATTLQVRRIAHRWAGLRSFVEDRAPVLGWDSVQPGFFWDAALGGYGVQTAPAISRIAAALALGKPVDGEIEAEGVDVQALLATRLVRPA
jgi:D-arginine dehydrogenase